MYNVALVVVVIDGNKTNACFCMSVCMCVCVYALKCVPVCLCM